MLELDMSLPTGALAGPETQDIDAEIARAGGTWFCFEDAFADRSDGAPQQIKARVGTATLEQIEANSGRGELASEGTLQHYRSLPRSNSALAYSIEAPGAVLSFCLIALDANPSNQTLLGLIPEIGPSVFVAAKETGFVFQHAKTNEAATLPYEPDSARLSLIFGTMREGNLALALGAAEPVTQKIDDIDLTAQITLLLGARRLQKGLYQTLGDYRICDLFVFPGTDALAPEAAHIRAAIQTYASEVLTRAL